MRNDPAGASSAHTPVAGSGPIIFEHAGKGYAIKDIVHALRAAGIKEGDALFVHADLKSFGKLAPSMTRDAYTDAFIDALEQAVGESGTIIMPTFTYSFTKGEVYDPASTPSTVGILSERFRRRPGVRRSMDALFSVAAKGPQETYFTDVGTNCFGKGSIFEKLYDQDAKMVFLGDTFDITYMHFVEQRFGISYRFIKEFSGTIRQQGGKLVERAFSYNVRPLDDSVEYDLDALAMHFKGCGIIKESQLGSSMIRCVGADDAYNVIVQELKKNEHSLLKNKRLNTLPTNAIMPLSADEQRAAGNEMYAMMELLYPLCRSISGDGVRKTISIIRDSLERRRGAGEASASAGTPLRIHEVPSGTVIFDWIVPKEWNFSDAYVKDSAGVKVIDAKKHNLHLLNYSIPARKKISLAELKQHLFTSQDHPDAIPYLTSYYKEQWGFCLSQKHYDRLEEGEYEVVVDTTLKDGSMTYAELLLPGERDEEVLFSTYTCHPSMCNDNLSGVVLLAKLAQILAQKKRRYSYRFLFIPETIGAIAWLAANEGSLARIKAGMIVTCVGDRGKSTYKTSKRGDALIDKAAQKVLEDSGAPYAIIDFSPGSDERQFCSPAFNLPMGSLMRTPYYQYPQYHTSADDLDFVTGEALADTLAKYISIIFLLENDRTYISLNPKCEPRLGKRGLYRMIGAQPDKEGYLNELALLWVLSMSDGTVSLLDIAARSKIKFKDIADVAKALEQTGLLKEI